MSEVNNNQAQDLSELLQIRRDKLADLQRRGKDPFKITKYDVSHHSEEVKKAVAELEGKTVSVAGRMMSKRVMGKASFCHVQDLQGNIQIYVARDMIGEEAYADFKKFDIGDIIGVKGEVFVTKTGETSIRASEVVLLSKSLQILPEKYHGLTNVDLRYRQRYTDLIMNPDVKDTFIKRSKMISCIRRYLDAQGFIEVETPMLVANAGGAAARPFETHYNALDEDVRLRISLELYLKRLIVGGLERVYEIGRVFRNEGVDTRHNPEFTLMELYQAYTDYHGMMDLTENMFRYLAQEVCGSTVITYGENEIDLGKPFERLTMVDAVKKYADVDFNEISTLEEAQAIAKEKGRIVLYNLDAMDFLSNGVLDHYYKTFVNFDPPYVMKGSQLYKNAFSEQDHKDLYKLISKCKRKWIVTYDICPLIRELYKNHRGAEIDINYSASNSGKAREYIFFSNNLFLPEGIELTNQS